jgi:hypothetical protein
MTAGTADKYCKTSLGTQITDTIQSLLINMGNFWATNAAGSECKSSDDEIHNQCVQHDLASIESDCIRSRNAEAMCCSRRDKCIGIKLSYVREIFALLGGWDNFRGRNFHFIWHSIQELVQRGDLTCSIATHLSRIRPDVVGKAELMISYTWSNDVHMLIETIGDALDYEAFISIDIFCVDYTRRYANVSFEERVATTLETVKEMPELLLVLTPWKEPDCLTRVWCLLEILACIQSSTCRFQVCFPKDEQAVFLSEYSEDPDGAMATILESMNTVTSAATLQGDAEEIQQRYLCHDNMEKIASALRNAIIEWAERAKR